MGSAEREQGVGPFNADIVATDARGDPITIEKQYGKNDYDNRASCSPTIRQLRA